MLFWAIFFSSQTLSSRLEQKMAQFKKTQAVEILFDIFGRIKSNKCILEAKFKLLRESIIRKVVSEVFKTVTFAFMIKNGAKNQP